MDADVTFGEWLRRRRRTLDLTQEELADQVGCSAITIRKFEASERRPSKQLATCLAECLGIAPEQYNDFITFARAEPYIDPSAPPSELVEPLPWQTSPTQAGGRPLPTPSLPLFLTKSASPEKLPPVFVARERELAELEAKLDTARSGAGQILFVIGGAGSGKTMLVQEFARRAQAGNLDLLVVSGYCNAHTGGGDPYLPFREALSLLTGEVEAKWAGGLMTTRHARLLWEAMPLTLPALVEYGPELIDSFVPARALQARAATLAPAEAPWFKQLTSLMADEPRSSLERKRILAQYTAVLKTIAAQRPVLLILEDLHWVDTSSSDLLFHLGRQVGDSPILLVGTYRPEEVALSGDEERHPMAGMVGELKRRHGDIWLDLGELAPVEGRRFVEAYLDTQPNRLGPEFRAALFQHTGGHALFTVELLREMQERGDLRRDEHGLWVAGEAIDWQILPARVEGVIERRIGRLKEELQAILTIASVEGETFTAEVVARVQQVKEWGLVQQLSRELDRQHRLVRALALEWLDPDGQRLSLYRFRHHHFQHYLYHSLDEVERVYLHEAVGKVLEALYGEQRERVAAQLARHFEQAGLGEKAVGYLLQAGERAVRLSASEEAIAHFNRGLALLETLPDTPDRARQELNLQIALGKVQIVTKGYAAPEVNQTYERARRLCRQVGEKPQLFQILMGLWNNHMLRGDLPKALELGEQLLSLGQELQEPAMLVGAYRALGSTLFYLGRWVLACEHLKQGMISYDLQQRRALAYRYGTDPGLICHIYMAWAQWYGGYADQAQQGMAKALTLAHDLDHPHSVAFVLTFAAFLHQMRRERAAAQERAEAAIALSVEQGFAQWLATGKIVLGWALAEQGESEAGLVQLRQGLAAFEATGAKTAMSYFLAMLVEAYSTVGQPEQGLTVLVEVWNIVNKNEEHWYEAELHRLEGELMRKAEPDLSRRGGMAVLSEVEGMNDKLSDPSPEACFLRAIEVARQQEAKSLELRAVISLSRLWQDQGKKAVARRMLAEIYGWFTEGFDTGDLREAKALLEELS